MTWPRSRSPPLPQNTIADHDTHFEEEATSLAYTVTGSFWDFVENSSSPWQRSILSIGIQNYP